MRTATSAFTPPTPRSCEDESIDEIAAHVGVGAEVAAITHQAMGGTVTFQDSLAARLAIIRPSLSVLTDFLSIHPPRVSQSIPDIVAYCAQRGIQVFLVSGGFHQVIDPLAASMGIPSDHVFANRILHNVRSPYGDLRV